METAADLPCSLRALFFVIYKANLNLPNIYTFSSEAAEKYAFYFDENRRLIQESNLNHMDPFLR